MDEAKGTSAAAGQGVPILSGGAASSIPVPKPPKGGRWWQFEKDERNQLEKDGAQSHHIRRVGAYGAFVLAVLLYAAGVSAISIVLGLWPCIPRFDGSQWHIVVAVLAALFTVPTVLVLAVLRMAATSRPSDPVPSSVHEALGQMVQKAFDKLSK